MHLRYEESSRHRHIRSIVHQFQQEYAYSPPLKYSDRTSNFDIKPEFTIDGKKLYFTPKISENYLISLEVTNLNDSTIYVENFYYNAIDKGIKMKTISEKKI